MVLEANHHQYFERLAAGTLLTKTFITIKCNEINFKTVEQCKINDHDEVCQEKYYANKRLNNKLY